MKKIVIIVCCGLFVAGGLYFLRRPVAREEVTLTPSGETGATYKKKEVVLGNSTFTLEISDTPALQETGLSYRPTLAPNTGMLFMFAEPDVYQFWMKDMNFPIDIIWLDANKKVVLIEHDVAPSTYPDSFGPETLTQYVIEIPAGEAKRAGLKVGDTVGL